MTGEAPHTGMLVQPSGHTCLLGFPFNFKRTHLQAVKKKAAAPWLGAQTVLPNWCSDQAAEAPRVANVRLLLLTHCWHRVPTPHAMSDPKSQVSNSSVWLMAEHPDGLIHHSDHRPLTGPLGNKVSEREGQASGSPQEGVGGLWGGEQICKIQIPPRLGDSEQPVSVPGPAACR